MLITPIYDREESDVLFIKSLNNKILSGGFSSLTEEEQTFWLYGAIVTLLAGGETLLTSAGETLIYRDGTIRGAINTTDLNRIENNTVYLQDLLEGYGYIARITTHTEWGKDDFLYLADIDRIRQNVINLANAYYTFTISPTISLGNAALAIADLNDIEEVIDNINTLLENMLSTFRYSGTIYSGGYFE